MELFKLMGTIAVDNDKANKAIDDTAGKGEEAEGKLSKAFGKIATAVAAAFAVDKIINFGKEVVNMSAEVSAEQSAFEQIMGDYSDNAQSKVNEIASATGMVSTRLTPYMTSMTAKFKGLGYDIDDATDLASEGLNLAADAAAFWDKSLDDSMSHLNSFVNGSYEGGEAIGLFANDTQMAMYAVEQGIVSSTKEWANLDEATKQATRLEYAKSMYDQSGATGQAAKEAGQYANVQANLNEKWRQFKAQIGEPILQNIVLPAMEKLSGVVDVASEKFQALQKWISENQTTLTIWGGIIAGLITTIGTFLLILNWGTIMSAAAGAVKAVQGAMIALNTTLMANPIALVVAAIAGLVAAFIVLWNNCEGFREFWIGLWDKIKEAAGAVADWFSEKWQAISDWFINLWNTISGAVSAAWDVITNVVSIGIQLIASILDAAFQIITLPFRFIWENCKEIIISAWNKIYTKVSTAINAVKKVVTKVFTTIKNTVSKIWNAIKTVISTVWNNIKEKITTVINAIKTTVSTVFNAIKTTVSTIWNGIKTVISTVWDGIKTKVSTVVNAVKTTISNVFNAVKNTVTTIWNGIKTAITKPIEKARDTIKGIVDKIKGFFDFEFKIPKIKLPHFGIKPKGWKVSDLLEGDIPKLSIDWYAKAMNNPMLLDKPTIFGARNGQLMGAGEAGSEIVAGTNTIMGMISDAVASQTNATTQKLETLISMLAEYMPQVINNSNKQIVLDTGILAGQLAPGIDSRLGDINRLRERGR